MNVNRFFSFRNNSSYNRSFTYAVSLVPKSEVVTQVCSKCGSVAEYPSGSFDVVLEGGTKFPDVLQCGAYPFLIVSEAVITAWQEAKIECFHNYPVGIASVQSKRMKDVPPKYFRTEIDGRCRIDLKASGIQVIRICPECNTITENPKFSDSHGFIMERGSWDGCDIFRDEIYYPRLNFCTERVLSLMGERRLTNFRFEPMEIPPDPGSKGIKYF